MPIRSSVGSGGKNVHGDVFFVQLLLNDWRCRHDLSPIQVDGIVGPETIGAITRFQQRFLLIVDGRVDPDQETIRKLEELHLLGILTAEVCPENRRYLESLVPRPDVVLRVYEIYLRDLREKLG